MGHIQCYHPAETIFEHTIDNQYIFVRKLESHCIQLATNVLPPAAYGEHQHISHLNMSVPHLLTRHNECPADIMVASDPQLEWYASLFRITDGRRDAGIRNGNDHVSLYVTFLRQFTPKSLATLIDALAPDDAVRSRSTGSDFH